MAPRPPEAAVTIAILAGGAARRMGGIDKWSLSFGGQRIIDRQIATLRQIGDDIIVVGSGDARFAELGIRQVPDIIEGCGALGGIYSALVASRHPRTLVIACDMPFLNPVVLQRLVQAGAADVDIVMPRTAAGLQPLCAVYSARAAQPVRSRIERGLLKAAALAEELRVEEIGPEELATYDPDGLMFANVNTPHDYERAQELMDRLSGSLTTKDDRITNRT
jgi:molybdenum cofactor guanylyltransferase